MVINTETGVITHTGVSAAWGLIVMIMIFTFGRISGAHMNPAVTVSLALVKLHPNREIVPYLFAQLIGAFAASLSLQQLFPDNELLGASLPQGSEMQSFILEFILTFMLMIVILMTSQGRKFEQYFAPVVIGATIGLEALYAGPISNASMNPFRSLAPAVVSGHIEHLWLYLISTTLGALAAGFYWLWQREE